MDNSKQVKKIFCEKFLPFDFLLGYCDIHMSRSDVDKMAISSVWHYKELDNNKTSVRVVFPFELTSTTLSCSRQFQPKILSERSQKFIYIYTTFLFCKLCLHFHKVRLVGIQYTMVNVFCGQRLLTEDIPGSSLSERKPSAIKNSELEFWLRCFRFNKGAITKSSWMPVVNIFSMIAKLI